MRAALLGCFTLAYALLAHYTNVTGARTLGTLVALAPLILLTASAAWHARWRKTMLAMFGGACVALVIALPRIEHLYGVIYWLEHAGTELMLCLAFGRTLRQGREPMVSMFARLTHGKLSPALQDYTRGVTRAWVWFFGMMAAVSTLLFHAAPLETWSAFANFFTAPLIAVMFVAEYTVRRRRHPDMNHAHIMDSVRAYWKSPAR